MMLSKDEIRAVIRDAKDFRRDRWGHISTGL